MLFFKKLLIISLKTFAILFIILLPIFAIFTSSLIYLKTLKTSQKITIKENFLEKISLQETNQGFDTQSHAKQIIDQTLQFTGIEKPKLKWGTEDRVNVLLLGKASPDYPGSDLTDTIILGSYSPKTQKTAMLSIPRDLYVRIPNTKQFTKLNSIFHYGFQKDKEKGGIKYMAKVVEEITGQKIDYFVLIDFKGFEKLIDEIGGVRVEVKKEINDTRYPGPRFSYQTFHLDSGWQTLDGATALKYVRTRHDADGDFGRALRQQQVLKAIKNKFFSLEGATLLPKFNAILNIIAENIKTDIEFSEYGSFLAIAKDINVDNTVNRVLDNRGNDPVLINFSTRLRGRPAYFLRPKRGDYSEIQEIADNIFELNKLEELYQKRKNENPSITLINQSGNRNSISEAIKLLNEAGFRKIQKKELNNNFIEEKTTIYDNTEGLKLYSFDSLLKILQAEAKLEKNPNFLETDFVIILGNNIQNLNQKEEDILLPEEAYGKEPNENLNF